MIVKQLISRPIAVTMSVIALIVIGLISIKYIPVSLMPDIDVPQITVQVSYPGASVREVDNKVLRPLKNQLMQVVGVKRIRSESRTDAGVVYMNFEPQSNIDLLFIEVNEKIDRAMNNMPKEVERPKVLKASATDIPAFYLDVTLKYEDRLSPEPFPKAGLAFSQLGDFARNIVSKRIEQLPQTAMVDISGNAQPELLCVPDYAKMESMDISMDFLRDAIQQNNLSLGVLSVADGIYRYNIHFDSQITTKEDIENVYINHNGRIYQFKDLCEVIERPGKRKGMIRSGRNNAVTLAIIKQSDAQMADLKTNIDATLEDLRKTYPDISFEITRDQTQLLMYSINNLKNNLLMGAFLACIVLFVFMHDLRSPLLIMITIPLSLILTLLFFHLLGITLNIISLSGLILGIGMMVDNSIIVIDNITQKWLLGIKLKEAISKAVGEVFTPMLSSVLTTCSVFVPLVFLSGTAGALFYDQAMAVGISLGTSLLVSTFVIPVYFRLLYQNKTPRSSINNGKGRFNFYKPYEITLKWTLRHQRGVLMAFLLVLPLSYWVYGEVEKTRLPYIEHNDALMTIDWNAGISIEENDRRICELLKSAEQEIRNSTSMIGVQDFLLAHTKELTASEAIVYLQCDSEKDLNKVKTIITSYISQNYPKGKVDFSISGNIFDMIFSNDESDLEILLQRQGGGAPDVLMVRNFIDTLQRRFPNTYIPPIVTEENLRYEADLELMTLNGVNYSNLFSKLKELLSQQNIFQINQGSYSVPLTLGDKRKESKDLLSAKVKNRMGVEIPINHLVKESRGEDFKKLYSGNGGDYFPIKLFGTDKEVEDIVEFVNSYVKSNSKYSARFDGDYFSSRILIKELMLILSVAIALLYFILAAQFESVVQPLIILSEVTIDLLGVLIGLYIFGESLNIMSLIGIVVMCGIIINDSILKVDTINRFRKEGMPLLKAIMKGGHSRLKPIIMTSLTTILAIVPFLSRTDMGSALQYPLSLAIIIGMTIGTLVSLFFIPLMYYVIYRNQRA
ncbi:MAG: efflux RND transporter permease subunit [Marinifilaceae bacterium]